MVLLLVGAALPRHPVTLDGKEAAIHNVFRLFSRVGDLNVVVSEQVRGRVTLRLDGVPWDVAFEALLRSQGLGMERIGEVIWVDSLERIRERAETQHALNQVEDRVAELKTIVVPLNYARVDDISPIISTLLSDRGALTSDARTNKPIITDPPSPLARIPPRFGQSQ